MTPKEKAKELVLEYVFYTISDFSDENFEQTKQFALIAVDEIIDALDKSLIDSDIEWWQEVKQEIKKL
jgi:hypothetical protein